MLLIVLLNFSCALKPPDVRICTRYPFNMGGTCNNTITEAPYEMTELEVETMITYGGMIYFSAKDYGEIKKFILEACLRTKKCDLKKTENRFDHIEGTL